MDHSGTAQGRVAAYNLADRSLLWQHDLPFPLPHIVEFLLPTLQMTEVENNLLVMTGPAVIALDARSGKEAWRYLFYEDWTDIDVGNFLVYNNGSVYAGADARILKLDPSNGRKVWEAEAGGLIDQLVAGDDNLYFSSSLTFSATIYSIDAETGKVKYQLNAPDSGVLGGFTSAFDVSNNYLVNIGRMKMYGYRLPD
jgi:outer membrane protein assembly factor BamB